MEKNDDPTRVSDGSSRVETFPKDMSNHAGNRKIRMSNACRKLRTEAPYISQTTVRLNALIPEKINNPQNADSHPFNF